MQLAADTPTGGSQLPLLLALLIAIALHALLLLGPWRTPQPHPAANEPAPLRLQLAAQRLPAPQPMAADKPAPAQPEPPAPPAEPVKPPAPPPRPQPAPRPRPAPQPPAEPASSAKPTPAPSRSAAELLRNSRSFVREMQEAPLPEPSIGPRERIVLPDEQDYLYAAYLAAWQSKVENIGNLNYPRGHDGQPLSGEMVVDVVVEADGTVSAFHLMRPSHSDELDQGARHIIELSGRFAPFPSAMRAEVDRLHILRRWQFSHDEPSY